MLRCTLQSLISLLVALVVVATATSFAVSRSSWGREKLRDIIAQELANYTDREVRLGPVEGDLLTGVVAHDFAISEAGGFREGTVVSADEVQVRYNIIAVLEGRIAAAASVRDVTVFHPYVKLIRDRTGHINLQDLIKRRPPTPIKPQDSFRGQVYVRDGSVDLYDAKTTLRDGSPLRVRAREVQLDGDLSATGRIATRFSALDADGRLGRIQAHLSAVPKYGYISVYGAVQGADGAHLYRLAVKPSSEVQVLSATVSGSFSFSSTPSRRGKRVSYDAHVRVSDGAFRARRLGSEPVAASGDVVVTPAGVSIAAADLRWANQSARVSGAVLNFKDPTLNLRLAAEHLEVKRWQQFLPAEQRKSLAALSGLQYVNLDGQVVGSLQHANLVARATAPGRVGLADPSFGSATVTGATLNLALWDAAQPAMAISASDAVVQAANVGPLMRAARLKWPVQLFASEVTSPRLTAVVAGGRVVASGHLKAVKAHADDLQVKQAQADVAWVGDTLFLDSIAGRAMSADAEGRVIIEVPQGQPPRSFVSFTARGFDARDMDVLPLNLPKVSGLVDLTMVGSEQLQRFRGVARVRIVGLRYKDFAFDSGAGLLRIDGTDVYASAIHVTSDGGTLWARGNYEADGGYKFSVTGAEINAARLTRILHTEPLQGRVYAHAEVTGKGSDWHTTGDLFAFDPQYGSRRANLLAMSVSGGPTNFRVSRAWLSRGSAIAKASGTVTGFSADALAKSTVNGEMYLAAVPVRDVLTAAGVHADADGYAEVTATVAGELGRPRITGTARTGFVTYKDFAIDSAIAPFRLSEDALVVDNAVIAVGDARITGGGRVDDLREKPYYAAGLAATGLKLENLAPLHERHIDAIGEVRVPVAEIRGTADDLTGRVRIVAPSIVASGGVIRNFDATFSLDKSRLQLVRGELDIADADAAGAAAKPGHISAAGAYSWGDKIINAAAAVTNVPVTRAVQVARPIAWAILSEQAAAGNTGQPTPTLLAGGVPSGPASPLANARGVLPDIGAIAPQPRTTLPTLPTSPVAAAAQTENTRDKLDHLLASLGAWMNGTITGGISLLGPLDNLESVMQADITGRSREGVALPDVSIGDKQAGGIRYAWARRAFSNIRVAVSRGDALVTVDGSLLELGGRLELRAEASSLDLGLVGDWLPYELQTPTLLSVLSRVTGKVGILTATARGTVQAPTIRFSTDMTDSAIAGAHFDLVSAPVVTIREGDITVDGLLLKRGEREARVDAKIPFQWSGFAVPSDKPLQVGLKLQHTPVKAVSAMLYEYLRSQRSRASSGPPPADLWATQTEDSSGSIDADLRIVGTPKTPELEGSLRIAKAAFDLPAPTPVPVRNVGLDVSFSPQGGETMAHLTGLQADVGTVAVNVGGEAHIRELEPGAWHRNQYDVTATVKTTKPPQPPLATLKPLVIAESIRLRTEDTSTPRQVISFTTLGVPDTQTRLDLTGTMQLEDFSLSRLAYARCDLKASVNEGFVRYDDYFAGLVSADLAVRNPEPGKPAEISGQASISQARLSLPVAAPLVPKTLYAVSSRWPSPTLNVAIGIGDNVALEGALQGIPVRIPLEPFARSLVAIGTPQRPVIAGRIEAQRGWASVPMTTSGTQGATAPPVGAPAPSFGFGVSLEELAFLYQVGPVPKSSGDPMPLRFDTHLYGRGVRDIPDVVVEGRRIDQLRLLFTIVQEPPSTTRRPGQPAPGPLNFAIDVSSDPPLGREEINRIIGTQLMGDPLFGLAEGLKLRVFQPIEERLRAALGLAELSLNFQFNQPVDVRIGKYLIKHMYVSYRRTLAAGQEQYNLSVSYQLPNKMLLSIATDEIGDRQVRLGYSWSFGR